ncbi:MAG: hypothetical protein Q7U75_18565, partial [Desulfobacterales bacterium]|nr:hypothetical protein [Desulfobacterales bacterium]
ADQRVRFRFSALHFVCSLLLPGSLLLQESRLIERSTHYPAGGTRRILMYYRPKLEFLKLIGRRRLKITDVGTNYAPAGFVGLAPAIDGVSP